MTSFFSAFSSSYRCPEPNAMALGEQGEIRASVGLVQLPAALSADIREIEAGLAVIMISGLPEGWVATAMIAGLKAHAEKLPSGGRIILDARQHHPATVVLIFSEPESGKTLRLSAPWPARDPILGTSDQRVRLRRDFGLIGLAGARRASGGCFRGFLTAISAVWRLSGRLVLMPSASVAPGTSCRAQTA